MRFLPAIIVSLLLCFGTALAQDATQNLQSKADFTKMKSQVMKDLGERYKYKEIAPDDQATLVKTLNRMDERWQHADGSGHLNPNDQVAMINDQEVVTTILSHAEDSSRIVCERVPSIGSNLPKRVCKSVAQREHEQKVAQDAAQGGTLESSN